MVEPVVLRGAVVLLEPLRPHHVDALVVAASEDRSTYGFTAVPDGRDAMAAYVATAVADEGAGAALPFAIRLVGEEGRVVGSTRFLELESWDAAAPRVGEIGATWLAASVQRSAVNTEAKRLLLGLAFDTWALERVTLKTDARNVRSRAAIERIGARFEGVRRAHQPAVDGTVRDSAYFSILRAEWPEVRAHLDAVLGRAPSGGGAA